MATVYIHAGTPKTGTSAIQAFCIKNNDVLKQHGVLYPKMEFEFSGISVNRNGHFLNRKEKDEDGNRLYDKEKEIVNSGLEKISQYVNEYDKIVLSDEYFWNNRDMNNEKWNEYKNRFAEMGADLKLIVYLRRQDLMIQSYWAQLVKQTMTMSFKEYIESEQGSYFILNYDERLAEMAEAVGKENIIVRVYEKQQYYGGNITSDFLNILGLELTDEYIMADKIFNVSLEGPYLEVKRLLNYDEKYGNKRNFLVPHLRDVQLEQVDSVGYSKALYFTKQEQRDFMKQYDDGNALVAKEYMNRQDGVLFKDEVIVADDETETTYTVEELVLIMGEVISKQQNIIDEKTEKCEELKERIRELKKLNASYTGLKGAVKAIMKK